MRKPYNGYANCIEADPDRAGAARVVQRPEVLDHGHVTVADRPCGTGAGHSFDKSCGAPTGLLQDDFDVVLAKVSDFSDVSDDEKLEETIPECT